MLTLLGDLSKALAGGLVVSVLGYDVARLFRIFCCCSDAVSLPPTLYAAHRSFEVIWFH